MVVFGNKKCNFLCFEVATGKSVAYNYTGSNSYNIWTFMTPTTTSMPYPIDWTTKLTDELYNKL